MFAWSPTGAAIAGTLETVAAVATIAPGSFRPDADDVPDRVDWDYSGQTDIWWNDQHTQTDANGQRLYVDANQAIWPESALRFTETDDSPGAVKQQEA